METLLDMWSVLDPTLQATLIAALAGTITSALLRIWERCPWLPWVRPDTPALTKWIAACILAALSAYAIAGDDWQRFMVAYVAAFGSGQGAHNAARAGAKAAVAAARRPPAVHG